MNTCETYAPLEAPPGCLEATYTLSPRRLQRRMNGEPADPTRVGDRRAGRQSLPASPPSRAAVRSRRDRRARNAVEPASPRSTPELPSFLSALHGRVGDRVYKMYCRKLVIARVPDFAGYEPTAAQRARRDRLREATAYAKRIYADPAVKAFYVAAAKKLRRHPFRLAVSDHLTGHARVPASGVDSNALPRQPDAPALGRAGGRRCPYATSCR